LLLLLFFDFVQKGVLLKWLVETIGERYVIVLCFALGVVNNFMYGVARNKRTVFVAIAIGSFVGMSFPTISAIKANNVVRVCIYIYNANSTHKKKENALSNAIYLFFLLIVNTHTNIRRNRSKEEFKALCTPCQHWHLLWVRCFCERYITLPRMAP